MEADRLRVLLASTPVGPIGSGLGGGVELTLATLATGLAANGHHVEAIAPAGSVLAGTTVHQVDGALQPSSQHQPRWATAELPAGSVLAAMWREIHDMQSGFDVVVNFAYDWLPMYTTAWFDVPVVHLVSMGSTSDAMDAAIADVARRCPGRLAAHTAAQAATYADPGAFRLVGSGIATARYAVRPDPDRPPHLGFVGRIAPEKGLEDAVEAAAATGMPLRVWGKLQDERYWAAVVARHPPAQVEYRGFLPTAELQAELGGCTALLMTPKWVEAFGNVAIEAMATGVPVIAYARGGPAEIVVDGETGFVVPADDVDALIAAIGRIDEVDRAACRRRVDDRFSATAFAGRVEAWIGDVLDAPAPGATTAG